MKSRRRINKKVWVILLMAGLVIEFLFDPFSSLLNVSENIQARVGLPSAQTRWDAQMINHYKFDISGSIPLVCSFNGNIEVRDRKVVNLGKRSDADSDVFFLSEGEANLPALCDYRTYTVPLLFDELQRWLQESPLSITRISFNAKYGFISRVRVGSPGGWGLLSPRIFDCCTNIEIQNFQVLRE